MIENILNKPTKKELIYQKQLQKAILETIRKNKLSDRQISEKIGLLPVGVQNLMEKNSWSLETSFRFAEALGLNPCVRIDSECE